jgi:hypothetical protein
MDGQEPQPGNCPECKGGNTRLVESVSREAMAWYFRCRDCAAVWSIDKSLDAIRRRDTEPTERDRSGSA